MESNGCRIGVWITAADYTDRKNVSPEAFKEEAVTSYEEILTRQPLPDRPDEYQLILNVDQVPALLLSSTG